MYAKTIVLFIGLGLFADTLWAQPAHPPRLPISRAVSPLKREPAARPTTRPTTRPIATKAIKPPALRTIPLLQRRAKPPQTKAAAKSGAVRPAAPAPTRLVTPRATARTGPTSRPVARRMPTSRPALVPKKGLRPLPLPSLYPPVDAQGVMYLQPGTNTTQLGSVGQANWFGLRVLEAGWYVLQTKGRSDPQCALYRTSFRVLAHDDDSGERRNCRIIRKLSPGTYLFQVMLLPNRRTRYTFSFQKLQETSLALDQPEKNKLQWPGDLHLYRFQIDEPDHYQLSTTGKADTICHLLAPDRQAATIIARDDDSGEKRNCALTWHFLPGTYTAMVTGSYVGRGPYTIKLKKATTPTLKFHVMDFGKLQRDLLGGPEQAHRYRFSLKKPARVTFLAAINGSTPQLLLRRADTTFVMPEAPIAKLRGRFWITSLWLNSDEYELEIRATGKARRPYMLFGHIENDVLLPANRARPVANGVSQSPGKAPFRHALFRVALDGRYYSVLESDQPKMLACFLETLDGQQVAVDMIPTRSPRPCRIATTGRSGVFLFRVLFFTPKYVAPKRVSLAERRQKRREYWRNTMRRRRMMRRKFLDRRRYHRDFRRLYRKPTAPPTQPPVARPEAPPPKMMVMPLLNQWKGPQVRMIQSSLRVLAINQSAVSQAKGVLLRQVDVPKADLYWFSTRGASVQSCRIEQLLAGTIKQSPLAQKGCDVAVYLQRGSYLFRVNALRAGRRTLSWRSYRSSPSLLGDEPVVVGPVKAGQEQQYQLRIGQDGFFRLSAALASSVPLKTSIELKQGDQTIKLPATKTNASHLTGYLTKGTYQLQIRVTQGRGAYSLSKHRMPSQSLKIGTPSKARLAGYDDIHFFRVVIKRRGSYQFATAGKLDTICALYDSKNKRLASNDDSGPQSNCLFSHALRPGTYSIKVRNLSRKAGEFRALFGPATAKVARRSSRFRRLLEILRRRRRMRIGRRNRRGRRAFKRRILRKQIVVGKTYKAVLRGKGDVHLYSFQVAASGRYIIETRGPAARTDTRCSLYKGKRLIASNDDSGQRLHCLIRATLRPGAFRLLIRLALSTRAGPYQMSVRRVGAAWPGVAIARRRRRGNFLNGMKRSPGRTKRAQPGKHWLGSMRRGTKPAKAVKPGKPAKAANQQTSQPANQPANQPTSQVRAAQGIVLTPGLRSQAMTVRFDRVDLYTIKIPIAGTYEIETDGHLDTKCYLDDLMGGVIAVNEDGGDAANCRIVQRLPYGTYQLRVSIRSAGRIGPYGVSLRIKRR